MTKEFSVLKFQQKALELSEKMKVLSNSWVTKYPLLCEVLLWHYERKFLKLVKRLKNGR
jgi:hypothetical protein